MERDNTMTKIAQNIGHSIEENTRLTKQIIEMERRHNEAIFAIKNEHNSIVEQLKADYDLKLKESDTAQALRLDEVSTAFAKQLHTNQEQLQKSQEHFKIGREEYQLLKTELDNFNADMNRLNGRLNVRTSEIEGMDRENAKLWKENNSLKLQMDSDNSLAEKLQATILRLEESNKEKSTRLEEAHNLEDTRAQEMSQLKATLIERDEEIAALKQSLAEKDASIRDLENQRAMPPPPATPVLFSANTSVPTTPIMPGPSTNTDSRIGQKRPLEAPDIIYLGLDNRTHDLSDLSIDPALVNQIIDIIQRNGDAGKRTNNCARSISKNKKSVYTPEYPDSACIDCTKARTLCARAEGGCWMILPLVPSKRIGTVRDQTYWVETGLPSPGFGN